MKCLLAGTCLSFTAAIQWANFVKTSPKNHLKPFSRWDYCKTVLINVLYLSFCLSLLNILPHPTPFFPTFNLFNMFVQVNIFILNFISHWTGFSLTSGQAQHFPLTSLFHSSPALEPSGKLRCFVQIIVSMHFNLLLYYYISEMENHFRGGKLGFQTLAYIFCACSYLLAQYITHRWLNIWLWLTIIYRSTLGARLKLWF